MVVTTDIRQQHICPRIDVGPQQESLKLDPPIIVITRDT
jgi:hypothetical protein